MLLAGMMKRKMKESISKADLKIVKKRYDGEDLVEDAEVGNEDL